MLYRPNFCANCGEKIDRVEWGWLTSRRFCPVCESVFKGQDLIPRVIVFSGIAIGVLGIGTWWKSGKPASGVSLTRSQQFVDSERGVPELPKPAERDTLAPTAQPTPLRHLAASVNSNQPPAPARPPIAPTEVSPPQYFCGAETKKGDPCSRRVKGNIRCYQHVGMPAMLSADKLRVN